MKLSEAIRLGAMLSPKGCGGWMDGDARCALAAASDALGIPAIFDQCYQVVTVDYASLRTRFPDLLNQRVVIGSTSFKLEAAIWHLNDSAAWTREQIADWVETLESQSTEPTTAPVEDSAEIQEIYIR